MADRSDAAVGVFAYRSNPAAGLARADIASLVGRSWKFNVANDLTGLLMFEDGKFQQVIEGKMVVLSSLVAAILADPRHEDIEVIRYGLSPERLCDCWTVSGFENILQAPPETYAHRRKIDAIVQTGVFEAVDTDAH